MSVGWGRDRVEQRLRCGGFREALSVESAALDRSRRKIRRLRGI